MKVNSGEKEIKDCLVNNPNTFENLSEPLRKDLEYHCGIAETIEWGFCCEEDIKEELHSLCEIIGYSTVINLLGKACQAESEESEQDGVRDESDIIFLDELAQELYKVARYVEENC